MVRIMSLLEITLRLLLSVAIGGAIGYEREQKNRPAGFRTHILVCVGAAVIAMIEQSSGLNIKIDGGRLTAQVISGIGFLGAGTIIRDNGSVKGLTTAASLWVVACLGLGAGYGLYTISVLSSIAVFGVLVSLKSFENKFFDKVKVLSLQVSYDDKAEMLHFLTDFFNANSIKIKNIEFVLEEDNIDYSIVNFIILIPRYMRSSSVIQEISLIKGVIKVDKL